MSIGIDIYIKTMEDLMKAIYPECSTHNSGSYDTIYGKAGIVHVDKIDIYIKPSNPKNKISVMYEGKQWDFNELSSTLHLINNLVEEML